MSTFFFVLKVPCSCLPPALSLSPLLENNFSWFTRYLSLRLYVEEYKDSHMFHLIPNFSLISLSLSLSLIFNLEQYLASNIAVNWCFFAINCN
jgi:ACR3 family arsenite efflux pump ArsB